MSRSAPAGSSANALLACIVALSRKRYWVLALCVIVGAAAASLTAEVRGNDAAPSGRLYRAEAAIRLYDPPLAFLIKPPLEHRIDLPGAMEYQLELASGDKTLDRASAALSTPPQTLRKALTISREAQVIRFQLLGRGKERTERTLRAVVHAYSAARAADLAKRVRRAREVLVRKLASSKGEHERAIRAKSIHIADNLLRRRPYGTTVLSSSIRPLGSDRSPLVAAALGAAAGLTVVLLLLATLSVLAFASSKERTEFEERPRPTS